MKILVVGSGGREHALVWKLAQSHRVSKVYCAPGNAGISQLATCVPILGDDLAGLKSFVQQEPIDLTVVGPEVPLALGIADEFRRAKLRIFGPTRNAAKIESSKRFSKDLMIRQGIPTPRAPTFTSLDQALAYLDTCSMPIVIKADGLAQGKGVVVAKTLQEAQETLVGMLERHQFGSAGSQVLVEDFVEGDELTVMAFADGKTVVPMIGSQDHKRVGEGDTGANTGGMGAYAPTPLLSPSLRNRILQDILYPAIEGLSRVGSPFYGILYAGLMVKEDQPFALEFNARFGDPETQVVLPLLKTDLLEILEAVIEHRLDQLNLEWHESSAVCVVLTSEGYPGTYHTDLPISGLPESHSDQEVTIFHAGTAWKDHQIVTAGGRVLGVTGIGPDIQSARDRAYATAQGISFQGRYYRKDIACRALTNS